MDIESIKKIFAEKMEIPVEKITESATLSDLEIDSLDMLDIAMDIEDELGISMENLKNVDTVGDVIEFIKNNG